MDLIECLVKTGLTRQEALLYIKLSEKGALTGYEAAKAAGISRSNAYTALAELVQKGAACSMEGDVLKYSAVPIKEYIGNLKRKFDKIYEYLEKNIPTGKESPEAYITVSGKTNVINKIKNILLNAESRIYISMSIYDLKIFEEELKSTVERGLKVVIITDFDFELNGAIIYHANKKPGQIRLISDSVEVFTGELGKTDASCLYSKNGTLIQLIKDSLTNEIQLILALKSGAVKKDENKIKDV